MGRYTNPKPLPPDHPIYREGLTFYTPLTDRGPVKPPEPRKEKPEQRDQDGEDK